MTRSSVSSSRGQLGDDRAVAEDIGAVAILQLLGLGRVPEEGAAAARLLADRGRRPRAWCRSRRRASGRPSARSRASEPSARANSAFCWLPPESDRMLLPTSGVRILMRSRQASASAVSRRGEISGPDAQPASERTPMFLAIDHCGKTPSECRSPATRATGRVPTSAARTARRGRRKPQAADRSGRGRRAPRGRRSRPHARPRSRDRRPAAPAAGERRSARSLDGR